MVDSVLKNNPGNLRTGQPWVGLSALQDDTGFCTFDDAEHGIRAMMLVLMSYAKQGINTIEGIITHWAPPSENDTPAYIAAVSKALGVPSNANLVNPARGQPDKPATGLVFAHDKGTVINLCKAIIKHEIGKQPYLDPTFNKAWELSGL